MWQIDGYTLAVGLAHTLVPAGKGIGGACDSVDDVAHG